MSLLQAKVQQKSEKISAFGGIFFVLDKFDRILSSVIDSHLGLRRKPSGNCSRSMLSKLIRVTHRRSQEIIEKTKCFPDYFLARISQKESPDQLTSKHGSVFDYSATFPIPFISNATCTPSARKARIIEASVMLFPLSKRQT